MVALACIQLGPGFFDPDGRGALLRRALSFDYNRTVLATNYFDHGFVRRGLGGTLLELLGGPAGLAGPVLFHILSALAIALVMIAMLRRMAPHVPRENLIFFGVVATLGPQFFLAWAFDIARTDMLIGALRGLAVLALLRERATLAALLLAAGLLMHEASLIVGLPLLAAVGLAMLMRGRRMVIPAIGAAAILILTVALIYWAQASLTAPDAQIIASVKALLPPSQSRDGALYVLVAGTRGVAASMCWNQTLNPHYTITLVLSAALLLVQGWMLGFRGMRHWALYLLAVAPPFAFLSYVASDLGRWYMFAALNGWMLAVALQIIEHRPLHTDSRALKTGIILFAILFLMGPTRYAYPNPASKLAIKLMGYPRMPDLENWIERCDPGWRDTIAVPSVGR